MKIQTCQKRLLNHVIDQYLDLQKLGKEKKKQNLTSFPINATIISGFSPLWLKSCKAHWYVRDGETATSACL